MDKKYFETLLSKVKAPERVAVNFVEDKYVFIASAENSNDTIGWFTINSNIVEEYLEESGLSWCYVIEMAPKKSPCIYMFIGKGLTKEYVIDELEDELANIPENIHLYFEDKPFSSIDIDDYDNSISEFEKELLKKASDVFKVYKS